VCARRRSLFHLCHSLALRFIHTAISQVTNCAKVNTQRSFADIAAALAAAEAELQQLRSSAATVGDAGDVDALRAAAAAESQRRVLLEGELQSWKEREAAVSAGVHSSRDEAAKCRADLARCICKPLMIVRRYAAASCITQRRLAGTWLWPRSCRLKCSGRRRR
jgi:hypothetical protein